MKYAFVALLFCVGPAIASETPIEGGPGGGDFGFKNCPSNHVLVGFDGRVGGYVDKFTVLCAPFRTITRLIRRPDGTRRPVRLKVIERPIRKGDTVGRSNGGYQLRTVCEDGSAINRIRFDLAQYGDDNHVVNRIEYSCKIPAGRVIGNSFQFGENDGGNRRQFNKLCPEGEFIIGFRGRSGDFIDALGTTCRAI